MLLVSSKGLAAAPGLSLGFSLLANATYATSRAFGWELRIYKEGAILVGIEVICSDKEIKEAARLAIVRPSLFQDSGKCLINGSIARYSLLFWSYQKNLY
jgi:hypothetical protein